MTQATKTRKQTEIQAATINRVSSKSGEFLGYLVKSNSTENYYQVTYNTSSTRYECNCAAFSKCCHIRAVEQVQAAKAEIAKQGNTSPAPMPYTAGLKTSFSSVEEEFQYKLGAHGKKVAYGWLYEQKAHTTVEVVPTGQAEEVAAVAEVEAEAKMDAFKRGMDEQYASDPRTELAKQIEARETAESNLRAYYNGL